eukprot:GHVN01030637.1.p1 GENE.GHVN01030637.1~~GHVN01030637.1.p1  ORF type:complete len:761 (+),score=147.10 GHVN01030637.1:165-2447(+)
MMNDPVLHYVDDGIENPSNDETRDRFVNQLDQEEFRKAFKSFLDNFQIAGVYKYKDQIRHMYDSTGICIGSLQLSLDDLEAKRRSDEDEVEGDESQTSPSDRGTTRHQLEMVLNSLLSQPLKYMPAAEEAVKELYYDLVYSGRENYKGTFDKSRLVDAQIDLIAKSNPTKIRDLGAAQLETLKVITGIVVQAFKPQHKLVKMKLQCRDCKQVMTMRLAAWKTAIDVPRQCTLPRTGGDEAKCGLDPYTILSDESKYCDVQTVKIQELPEDVPTGDMPRQLILNVSKGLCGAVVPGQRVYVTGIFSAFDKDAKRAGSEAVRTSYLHALGLCTADEAGGRKYAGWSEKEEDIFKKMALQQDIYEQVVASIAPAIYGHQDIKKAVALMLFGGSRKALADGTKLRGDINILLIGDPSTAKSQFLKFTERVSPVAVYTSGKGSSAAGLTAAIVKDSSGNFSLEGGAMVLADGGVVCIDEFDKMRSDDRVAIHEAMEQQTISIAKAGITTVLNTQCSVLAASNPTFGSFDVTKDTAEQHDFEQTILSRFDLIWIVRDVREEGRDKTIAQHVFSLHSGDNDTRNADGPIPVELLRKYLSYCRHTCSPRLSDQAAKRLENFYVEVRQANRDDKRKQQDKIPITVRQLESLARLGESLAKMRLCDEVDVSHVEEAMRLFQLATIEANKSIIAREILTPQEKDMIRAAEDAILNRLPLGARAAKASILRDLKTRGYETTFVGRALRILIQRGILQERGDASVRRVDAAPA